MHPYSRASMASTVSSNRALSLNGALDLSKSSVENFLKHPQAISVRRLISRVMSASSVMAAQIYELVDLDVLLAGCCDLQRRQRCCWCLPRLLRLLRCPHQESFRLLRHGQAKRTEYLHDNRHHSCWPCWRSGHDPSIVGIQYSPYRPPHPVQQCLVRSAPPSSRNTINRSSRMVLSSLKRCCSTTSIAAAKKMLNSNGDSTHPSLPESLCELEPFRAARQD